MYNKPLVWCQGYYIATKPKNTSLNSILKDLTLNKIGKSIILWEVGLKLY